MSLLCNLPNLILWSRHGHVFGGLTIPVSFMINVKGETNASYGMTITQHLTFLPPPAIDGIPLDPLLTAHVLSRAGFHYGLGIRGFFFAVPLVSWLFGSAVSSSSSRVA